MEPAEAEGSSELTFDKSAFWDKEFYSDVDCLYDWYSSEEWLSEIIATTVLEDLMTASGTDCDTHESILSRLRLLDVGCGTCPLVFRLASQFGFKNLVGVDFAARAIDVCNEVLQRKTEGAPAPTTASEEEDEDDYEYDDDDDLGDIPPGCNIEFKRMDACTLSNNFQDEKFDVIVDKGCLDCFISGEGQAKVAKYLEEVAAVLSFNGYFVLVPVNGADIPLLLETLTIKADPRAGAVKRGHQVQKWEANKSFARVEDYTQQLFISKIVARDEKHMFLCSKQRRQPDQGDIPVVCGVCFAVYSSSFPNKCPECNNCLQRFALS